MRQGGSNYKPVNLDSVEFMQNQETKTSEIVTNLFAVSNDTAKFNFDSEKVVFESKENAAER